MKRRVHIVWQLTRFERAAALAVVLALLVAVPVLAAYLGPDRSYTYTETELEKVRDESKDKWTLTHVDPLDAYSDTCISNSSCDAIPNITWQQNNCGWIADNASCELGYTWVETIIVKTGTHPAATVSGSVTCGVNGANGWCLNSATLNITGSEPLAGETITGIEGELDGTPFFCGGNTCAVPTPNGQSDAEYWALSSWGDSSLKDTETLKLDLDLPALDGLVSGTPGSGGWYVSDVTLTADASDATSGLDFAQVRVDGGDWINNSTTLSTDGQYSVEFRAQDMAGQSVSVPASDVWVDATPPDVSLTPSGTAGLVGWYVSDVDVTLAASDATSGLSASQLQVNGGGWQAVGGVTLGEGVYTVDAEALDVAGNYNSTSLDVKVDTTAPALSVTESGTPGDGGWYTSVSVTLNASASDATSGVANIQMQTNGAGYASTTSQTVSGEGAHSVDTTASDAAGNSSSDSRTIRIDSVSPTLSLTSHNTSSVPDESGWVTVTGAVSDATSGPAKVQFSSDGGASWDTMSVDGTGGFDIGWDSTSVRNGEITLRVRPVDEASNVGATTSFTIYVKNDKPYVSLPAGCVAVWDPYAIDAGGGSNPLDGLSVTVSDPEGRWPAREYSFSSVPESWSWDRQFGDGTAAPPGEYDVTATARDTVGNTTARTGCISILDPDVAVAAATTDIETTDLPDEDDSPIGGTPPDTTGDAPTTPALPSLQKAMADPTGAPGTTKIPAPESGASTAEAARLALATAANAPAWGDAALALAALATAFVLARKQEREAEEAARLADLAMRAERRAMERHADDVMGGEVYVVQSGDSWFSIAGDVYGNQRMAGQLMEANGGGGPLYPGDKILLPPKKKDEVADPQFSQKAWETVKALDAQLAEEKRKASPAASATSGQQQTVPVEVLVSLEALTAEGITATEFTQLFPEISSTFAVLMAETHGGQQSSVIYDDLIRQFNRTTQNLINARLAALLTEIDLLGKSDALAALGLDGIRIGGVDIGETFVDAITDVARRYDLRIGLDPNKPASAALMFSPDHYPKPPVLKSKSSPTTGLISYDYGPVPEGFEVYRHPDGNLYLAHVEPDGGIRLVTADQDIAHWGLRLDKAQELALLDDLNNDVRAYLNGQLPPSVRLPEGHTFFTHGAWDHYDLEGTIPYDAPDTLTDFHSGLMEKEQVAG